MFGIDDAIANTTSLISNIVNKFAPDANIKEQGELQKALIDLNNYYAMQIKQLDMVAGQIEVNKIEAESEGLFKSGWRPFIGWICGISLAYAALIEPLLRFVAVVIFGYTGLFPFINTDITLQVLLGLLGLGTMRTFEKYSKNK